MRGQLAIGADRFRAERDAIRERSKRAATTSASAATRALRRRRPRRQPADPAALRLHRRRAPAHARDVRAHPRAAGPGWPDLPISEETDDGLPAGEGAFGICSFWAVECRARGGDLDGRHRRLRASARLRQRRRALCRGDRPGDRRRARQFPAGVHARRPDQRGAHARRVPRWRGRSTAPPRIKRDRHRRGAT